MDINIILTVVLIVFAISVVIVAYGINK